MITGVSIVIRITATTMVAPTPDTTTADLDRPAGLLAAGLRRGGTFTCSAFPPKVPPIKPGSDTVPTIPKTLQPHINAAFPDHVCLIGTVLPSGYAQITPRGSTMVLDDEHLALWERGRGSTTENLTDGSKITVFFRKPQLRADGTLPKGGIARFYGTARIVRSGPEYEEVWRRLVQPEKDRDPDKKGFAVLIRVDRAEELDGTPLKSD